MSETKRYPIPTVLGTVLLQMPSGADYVFVEFGRDAGVFQVRGVDQSGSMRFKREKGGPWFLDPAPHAFSVNTKWNGRTHIHSTRATDDKIKAVVVPAVGRWLAEHPEVVEEARERQYAKDIENAEQAVKTTHAAWCEAVKTLEALQGDTK